MVGLLACLAVSSVAAPLTASVAPLLVVYKKDVRLNTVFAWERSGNFINAVPGDGKEIPYDAARLAARVYTLPTGEIRVIDFNARVRTHPHFNMTDTVLYTWTGRRVQFADGQAAVNVPGDAAFHPRGVEHHGEALETGKGIEFAAFVDRQLPDPEVTWVKGASRPLLPTAAWIEGRGIYREATGAAATGAPADAARFTLREFEFPPYTTREYHVAAGTTLPIDTRANQLLFLLQGRAEVSADGKTLVIGVEDAAHARAGAPFLLRALEDVVFLSSSIPIGTPPPAAFR
jgi:quercetin dioxygenase-like cupin family protein